MRLTEQESNLLLEIWSSLKNNIPSKDRSQAATDFVDVLVSESFDIENIYENLYGQDNTLDRALNLVAEFEETEDDEEDWLADEWDE